MLPAAWFTQSGAAGTAHRGFKKELDKALDVVAADGWTVADMKSDRN